MNVQGPTHQYNVAPPLPADEPRRRFRFHPGMVVVALGILLIAAIAIGILSNRESEPGLATTTIAELRADPEGWDNKRVRLTGSVESVRQLPLLNQYAIYTFHDETGSITTLTRNGAPPNDASEPIVLTGVFHSKVRLDDELKEIVSDQLGPLVGAAVETLVPGIPLDVIYLGHESYTLAGETS